jgi:hypothetical protein
MHAVKGSREMPTGDGRPRAMSPATTDADVDRHTEVFAQAIAAPFGG